MIDALLRCSQNAFVASDLEGRIFYLSPIMEEFSCWRMQELVGQASSTLYVFPDLQNISQEQELISQAAVVFTKDGRKLSLQCRSTKIKTLDASKKVVGTLVMFLTDSFTKNLDRAQAEFISTVSHELRTPITSIKGFASTLLHPRHELGAEKTKKYISIIKDQAERLSRLVEDLLAVSRLESKKLQLTIQPVDIESIVEKLATMIELKHNESHEITINVEKNLPQVWADPDRLEQILTNLLDNAVKYSPGSKSVEVRILNAEKDSERVSIEIRDHGIGIDKEDVEKVFSKFSRLDNHLTRVTEGTGLGLYVSLALAKLMNGDIRVKSKKDLGSCFTLSLSTKPFEVGELWLD
jgi:PAS domain S-box-containing protein